MKKTILPNKNDIKKLYSYLKNKVMYEMRALKDGFQLENWIELVKSSLIFIMIFNRRRAGEIERLSINSFYNKEVITDSIEQEVLQKMSAEAQLFAKQFSHLTISGKLGRTVSVILDPLSAKAIDVIIKNRVHAGIEESNEYIFSKKSTSQLSKRYYRTCPLLKQFATDCGAEFPESLRGTYLRKHIATHTSLLNVEDATVDQLANFMGHNKDIHKNVYRIPVPVTEITRVY